MIQKSNIHSSLVPLYSLLYSVLILSKTYNIKISDVSRRHDSWMTQYKIEHCIVRRQTHCH